ncbi:hypothetical protein BCR34DRAFT_56395 [Clohesyomyces aquaticus]|uniref:Siderophore biosynthesis enzyme n=1 Tax=Clohesyomyces aquaticus TaxID=1231657 RepID=A0A1Y1Z3P5_9PLEO|nr:hypothetical protein BCR34DRAFT_56395 [Clohesyomyces aquaticus]
MYTSTTTTTSALLLALAATISAKTDLSGCSSTQLVVNGGASMLYYVPGTGEICSLLDCGGGRAPPKTTVPGCAAYVGTASYTPDFISLAPTVAASTSAASAVVTASESASASGAAQTSEVASASASGSAPVLSGLPTTTGKPSMTLVATGTGGLVPSSVAGGNNVTGTATLSRSANPSTATSSGPASTGAANALKVAGQGVFGLAVGVMGWVML